MILLCTTLYVNVDISPADQEFEHHVLPLEAHGTIDETRPKAQ